MGQARNLHGGDTRHRSPAYLARYAPSKRTTSRPVTPSAFSTMACGGWGRRGRLRAGYGKPASSKSRETVLSGVLSQQDVIAREGRHHEYVNCLLGETTCNRSDETDRHKRLAHLCFDQDEAISTCVDVRVGQRFRPGDRRDLRIVLDNRKHSITRRWSTDDARHRIDSGMSDEGTRGDNTLELGLVRVGRRHHRVVAQSVHLRSRPGAAQPVEQPVRALFGDEVAAVGN